MLRWLAEVCVVGYVYATLYYALPLVAAGADLGVLPDPVAVEGLGHTVFPAAGGGEV